MRGNHGSQNYSFCTTDPKVSLFMVFFNRLHSGHHGDETHSLSRDWCECEEAQKKKQQVAGESPNLQSQPTTTSSGTTSSNSGGSTSQKSAEIPTLNTAAATSSTYDLSCQSCPSRVVGNECLTFKGPGLSNTSFPLTRGLTCSTFGGVYPQRYTFNCASKCGGGGCRVTLKVPRRPEVTVCSESAQGRQVIPLMDMLYSITSRDLSLSSKRAWCSCQ